MVRPFSLDPFLCQWGWWENKETFDQKQIPKYKNPPFRFLFALHHIIIEIFTFLCLRISFPSFSQLSLRFYPYLQSLRSKEKREEGNNESPEEKKSVLRRSCLFISLEKFHFFLGAAKIVQKSLGSYQKKKRPLFGQMYMNMTVWEENFFCFLFFFLLGSLLKTMGFQASRHVHYNFLARNEVRIKVKQQKQGEWTAKKIKSVLLYI